MVLCSVFCAILASVFLMPTSAFAADDENEVVRVGWFQSDLFQEGTTDDEPKSGYSYSYLRKLADYTSWKYEYVYGDWAELYDKLCQGEIDVMAGMSLTEERQQLMFFPDEPMETDRYYLYKHSDDSTINSSSLSSFNGKKIGLLKNNRISDFAEDWAANKNVGVQLIYFDSFDELHEAFENGEIDLEPRTLDGGSDSAEITAVVSLGGEASYLAVSKQRPDLLEELNEAINTINSVEPYALQELQYDTYGTVYKSRSITDSERTWLNEHSVIRVGYIDNYLPYCATDENGQATGLVTDVIDALFASLEIDEIPEVQYVEYTNYKDIAAALNSGEIDVGFPVSNNAWTLERDGISASSNVISDRGVLFYNRSCSKDSIVTIAANEGNTFQDEYSSIAYPNAEIVYYSTIDECLDAVRKGEVDGTIMDSLRVQYVTNRAKYDALNYVQLNDVTGKCFGVKQGDTALLMLVNRGLKVLGTSYGYDRAFQYVDQLYTYGFVDFVKGHLVETGFSIACVVAVIIALLILYIRKQKKELAIKEALKREAESANAAKSTFLFNMSHDIRTPMNAVLGFNELMLENIDNPDKLRGYIEKSKFSGEYLLGLINNVLEVARIDSDREALNEGFADLKDESYYTVFENEVRKKQLTVTRNVNVTHRYVYTDAQKIREILLNLISNAVKYTPAGGTVSVNLEERPCDREGWASYVCAISDTGIGMTEEFQEHIFDTFARERNSTESKVMGTGLGMTIVKRLTELMGGTVTVQSKLGEGSTFTVAMDMRIVENPEEFLKQEQKAALASPEAFRLDGIRILLAEDNDLNAEIATAILENLGAEIDVAVDGVKCIDMLQSHEAGYYSLILMDIQMPNLNGYEAAKKIRALSDSAKANIPIIAMTANAFDEDKKTAFAAGMNGHIAKPLEVKVLAQTIAEHIQKRAE